MTTHPERDDSLWTLTIAPTIWAVHFLLSYMAASVWCSKVGEATASIGGVRVAIALFTAVALAGIAAAGAAGYRRHGQGEGLDTTGHDFDSPEGRHRFLGFATVLLAGLSAVATLFTFLPAVFIETCR
jgi:hypothetical protein